MIHAKNYKTVSKFVKVMPRILYPLFFRTRCISCDCIRICSISLLQFLCRCIKPRMFCVTTVTFHRHVSHQSD